MVSSLASRIVSKRWPCSRSTFSEPNNVSEQALYQQLPLRLIDGVMPCSLSTSLKSALAYWQPRSLWKINPAFLPGLRLNQAISRASITRLRCISGRIDQPTTLRLNRSITTARNNQPSAVAIYVTSPTHAWLGAATMNLRSSTFGATDSRHNLPVAPNVLDRKFIVAAPNQAWVGDVTYIATAEGWLFLAVVIDLFSRKVVGWSMRPDMQRKLVIDALEMAWFKRNPGKKTELIFHSDRGSQYASDDFSEVLKEHGITPSMSRKGNCWDNACSETLFGSLKVERLHGQRFETIREAKDEVLAWLLWYNRTRMHSTLNYVSPVQFEQDWMEATVTIAA